ncbi:MAG: N-acetylmuramoyl-L-alanine amidase [Muribaculaceae bacterium]|nr:N-acetylmuramoyl-L-alanine amidase [Muribaculaceae bacterium]
MKCNFLTNIKKNFSFLRHAAKTAVIALAVISFPVTEAFSADNKFTVVIDAGHGGHDHGAIDNGAKEKDINLGVAKKLNELIRKNLKDVKTVMTREGDTFVSLQERANIANRNHGNLFISIHTNSVDKSNPNRKRVNGTSVYALGLHKDADNLKVARRENSVIELESGYEQKYSGFDPSKDESYIIFEMAQKKTLGQSLKFANEAQKQLVGHAGRHDRGVKQAGFWVLWATSMPAVLVELDFICNPEMAAFMNSEAGQNKMAEALYNAFKAYLDASGSRANPSVSSSSKKSDTPEVKDPAQVENGSSVKKSETKSINSKKGGKSKKQKSTKKKVSPTPEPSISAESIVEEDNDGRTPTLVNTTRKREKTVDHAASRDSRPRPISQTGSRKRRSSLAKKSSSNKDFEVAEIVTSDENAFLATVEKPSVKESVTSPVQAETASQDKKGKKEKNKKNKSKSGDSPRKNGSYKKITVSSKGDVVTSENIGGGKMLVKAEPKRHQSVSNHKVKTSHLKTVYKIQILASTEQLKENNPRFCGLHPISSFKENGLIKYTFGESEDKHEIERQLEMVKTKIPDAFIISAKK